MSLFLIPQISFILLLFIVAAYGILHSKSKFRPRKNFSESDKRETLRSKKYRCGRCNKGLKTGKIEFHHKDGNRCNANLRNCQALCKECHRSITSKDYNSYRNRTNW